MEHNCERHTFEMAEGMCRSCLGSFCADCLIYPFGEDQPPYCKSCAIAAAGVRSTAGNPRRQLATSGKVKNSRGTLFGRWRRGGAPIEEETELTREELIEIEAADARSLLEAQRLPSQPDEDPEPEPPPTPNIAAPGGFDDERELTHRTMSDEVAGGLDLNNVSEPAVASDPGPIADSTPVVDDDTPVAASAFPLLDQPDPHDVPDQAGVVDTVVPSPPPASPTSDQDEPIPAAGPSQATDDNAPPLPPPPTGDQDEPAAPSTPLEAAESPIPDREPALEPMPVEPVAVAAPPPSPPSMPLEAAESPIPDREPALEPMPVEPVAVAVPPPSPAAVTPAPAEPARTADGVELFAATPTTRSKDLLKPVGGDDGDAGPSATPERVPTPVGVGAATAGIAAGPDPAPAAARSGADSPASLEDVRDLLRRIADLGQP